MNIIPWSQFHILLPNQLCQAWQWSASWFKINTRLCKRKSSYMSKWLPSISRAYQVVEQEEKHEVWTQCMAEIASQSAFNSQSQGKKDSNMNPRNCAALAIQYRQVNNFSPNAPYRDYSQDRRLLCERPIIFVIQCITEVILNRVCH